MTNNITVNIVRNSRTDFWIQIVNALQLVKISTNTRTVKLKIFLNSYLLTNFITIRRNARFKAAGMFGIMACLGNLPVCILYFPIRFGIRKRQRYTKFQ